MFRAIHRRLFKSAVVNEFHRMYGMNLRAIGDETIGPGNLDDLLNVQYEETGGDAARSAKNAADVLEQSFGLNLRGMAMRARIAEQRD